MSVDIRPPQGPTPQGPFAAGGGGGSPAAPPYVKTTQSNSFDIGFTQTVDELVVRENVTVNNGDITVTTGSVSAPSGTVTGADIVSAGLLQGADIHGVNNATFDADVDVAGDVNADGISTVADVSVGGDLNLADDINVAAGTDVNIPAGGNLDFVQGRTRVFQTGFNSIIGPAVAPFTLDIDTDGSLVLADTTGGSFTITLPAAPTFGHVYIIKDVALAANTLTIDGNGINIDGLATFPIPSGTAPTLFGIEIVYTGASGWQVIGCVNY